jgi:hypothetical protein
MARRAQEWHMGQRMGLIPPANQGGHARERRPYASEFWLLT